MQPYYTIFGLTMPTYGSLLVLAGLVGGAFAVWRAKRGGYNGEHMLHLVLICLLGGLIGAQILQFITLIPTLIEHWDYFTASFENFMLLIGGGGVFYGALIGAILSSAWYIRHYKLKGFAYMDLLAPCIPLGHAIGRIGCFMGGCCYGIEVSHDHGVIFTQSIAAPNGVPLLPVQLIESACNIVICIVLLLLERRKKNDGLLMSMYLILYAVVRFVLEFFRGDLVRGVAAGISTSQLISIGILLLGVGIMILRRRRKTEAAESGGVSQA